MARPITKENRKKIGLSISGEANETLNYLSNLTGKTKSRIFEDAVRIMREREDIIYARSKNIEKYGDDAFMDFEEYMKNRKSTQAEKEVQNVS